MLCAQMVGVDPAPSEAAVPREVGHESDVGRVIRAKVAQRKRGRDDSASDGEADEDADLFQMDWRSKGGTGRGK